MDKDQAWYLKELAGRKCLCGREKKPRCSFCWKCYKALPNELQARLYAWMGQGYEANFEEAVKWLQEGVW